MTPKTPTLLLNLASAAGLLGAGLFYIGYIYRWSYFGYFQLGVHTLDLPLETFLFVPLQVLFGSPKAIINTIVAIFGITILFWISQLIVAFLIWRVLIICWIKERNSQIGANNYNSSDERKFFKPRPKFKSTRTLPVMQEGIFLLWVLLLTFHIAFDQGQLDARRDAVETTSVLPRITLIGDKNLMILGVDPQTLDREDYFPSALRGEDKQSLMGDIDLARAVQEQNLNENQQVWRLLLERGGWLYLIRTVPPDEPDIYPLIVAVAKSSVGKQMMILSPHPPK